MDDHPDITISEFCFTQMFFHKQRSGNAPRTRQDEILCAYEGENTLDNETGSFSPVLGGAVIF